MAATGVFDHRVCHLGEGVLWHPLREQLFWFDIVGKRLLSQSSTGEPLSWQFNEYVSAAGWIDQDTLLVASGSALKTFNLATGQSEHLCDLEADNPRTRSNDGRADPWGGFWIGTMGINAESDAGVIYRYYQGELRPLFTHITIPNAICFALAQECAYFTDTIEGIIFRQQLSAFDGWPEGEPTPLIDCKKAGFNPDGAVTDAAGNLWNAQWGASRVACYNPSGELVTAISFSASQISCPAFGGAAFNTLFAASATENLTAQALERQPDAGKLFVSETDVTGMAECQVSL